MYEQIFLFLFYNCKINLIIYVYLTINNYFHFF